MKNRNDVDMVAVTVDRFKKQVVQAVWPALNRGALVSDIVEQRHLRSVIGFLRDNAVQRIADAFTRASDRWIAQPMVRFYSRLGPSVPNTIAQTWESTIGLGPNAQTRDFSVPMRLLSASLRLAQDHRLEHTANDRYTVPDSKAVMITEGARKAFWRRMGEFAGRLQDYDSALQAALNGDEWSLGKWFVEGGAAKCNEEFVAASRRMKYAQGCYIFHELARSDVPSSDLWKRLLVHNATMVLGSQILFGGGGIFEGPADLLQVAEFWLEQAYLGQLVQGVPRPIALRTREGSTVNGELTFLTSHESLDGVGIGRSKQGADVVLRAIFERPVGRNGIAQLTGGEEIIGDVRVGKDDGKRVRVIKGEKPLSNTLYISGGSDRHAPGEFGLYSVFTGSYFPRTWSESFWSTHALLNGASTFAGLTGSAASISTGVSSASGLAACPLTI